MSTKLVRDNTRLLKSALAALSSRMIEIGIPTDAPNKIKSDAFNLEYGSPLQNIKADAFLEDGVKEAMFTNVRILGEGAKAVLELKSSSETTIKEVLNSVGDNTLKKVQDECSDDNIKRFLKAEVVLC